MFNSEVTKKMNQTLCFIHKMILNRYLSIIAVALLLLLSCCSQGKDVITSKSLFLEELTTFELENRIKQGYSNVLIYSGGTEATGPHVVLGKHNFRVKAYAQRVAEGLGNTLVAPILPFAPNHIDLQQFPGTISLDSLTFSLVNEQVALSMMASGFKHIIFMSDHYDSQEPLMELAQKLSETFQNQHIDFYYSGAGYAKARKVIEESIEKQNLVAGGHGGHWDVSETIAISNNLVRPNLFSIGNTTMKGNGPLDAHGVSGDPTKANAKDGKAYSDLRVKLYIEELRNHIFTYK